MRLALVLPCVIAGCGFEVTPGVRSDARIDSAIDAVDAVIDTPLEPPVQCSSPITSGLLACFELEDGVADGTLRDSSPARRDATATGLVATQRTAPATSAAAAVTSTVSTYVADDGALDRAGGYTVTMWIRPDGVPGTTGDVYGLYDHEQQYAAVLARLNANDLHLRCINTGAQYEYTDGIPVGSWSFIACTWTGQTLCAQYWSTSSNHQRFCTQTTIATEGSRGLSIGHLSSSGAPESPLNGAFDSLQLYERALTDAELGAIIGQPATCLPCTAGC